MSEEDLKKVVSTPFKRKGKDEIGKRAFVFTLALDLNWFSLDEARKILEIAKKKGFLDEKNEKIFPTFEVSDADVSLSFKPNSEFIDKIKEEGENILSLVIKRIQEEEDETRKEIVSEANEIQSEMEKLIDVEVAALLLAKEKGIEVSDLVNKKIAQLEESS